MSVAMANQGSNESSESSPFLDQMMETSEAAKWLRMKPRQLLAAAKGPDAKIPGFWINERVVRFHPRTIIARLARDAGLPFEVVAAMLCPFPKTVAPTGIQPEPKVEIKSANNPQLSQLKNYETRIPRRLH